MAVGRVGATPGCLDRNWSATSTPRHQWGSEIVLLFYLFTYRLFIYLLSLMYYRPIYYMFCSSQHGKRTEILPAHHSSICTA